MISNSDEVAVCAWICTGGEIGTSNPLVVIAAICRSTVVSCSGYLLVRRYQSPKLPSAVAIPMVFMMLILMSMMMIIAVVLMLGVSMNVYMLKLLLLEAVMILISAQIHAKRG